MKAHAKVISQRHLEVRVQGVPSPIWFKSQDKNFEFTNENLSNIVLLTAFPIAMKKGLDLEVNIQVCSRLVNNLNLVSQLWHQWRPDKFPKASRIIPNEAGYFDPQTYSTNSQKAIMAFSGGIDSTYAFVSRHESKVFPYVESAIMIDGFGYSLEDNSFYIQQYYKNKRYLEKYSVGLINVSTNYKKIVAWYPFFHAMGIAATMNLFGANHNVGVIGLDYTFVEERSLGPWGNLTILNMLYSSSRMNIEPSGGDISRVEKIKYLSERKELNKVTVCNFIEKTGTNCSNCEKCLRTMLMFEANNIDYTDNFEGRLTYDKVSKIKIVKNTQAIFYSTIANNESLDKKYRSHLISELEKWRSNN